MKSTELSHYGVKGMKWGVRRNRNATGADERKKMPEPKLEHLPERKKMPEPKLEHLPERRKRKPAREENVETLSKVAKTAAKAAKAVSGALAKIGTAYVADQMFFGGYGTTACKEALNVVGRATITGYTMARGGYDIKWYDKAGYRVG